MSAPIEAQSLSALTGLFANPPQYPRNPTHEVHEPLVLYIVRVPGSKDVFLTPLKPPTKASISLEAIQSSLYYLHVPNADDEVIRQSIDEERLSQDLVHVNPPIHRKPLPSTTYANYPSAEQPPLPPKHYPSHQLGPSNNSHGSQAERYMARGTHLNSANDPGLRDQRLAGRSIRPLGGLRQRPQSGEFDILASQPNGYRAASPYSSGSERSSPAHGDVYTEASKTSFEQLMEPGASGERRLVTSTGFKSRDPPITLIRRDPVSGGQWNVGTISHLGSDIHGARLRPTAIELTTPGYGRFSKAFETPGLNAEYLDADAIKKALANQTLSIQSDQAGSLVQQAFTRIVEFRQQAINVRPHKFNRRSDSSDSFTGPPSPTKLFRHVYSFVSPWNGTCSFTNGIDGKSLKCRHSLPSSISPAEEDNSANVAELRFNLPRPILPSNNTNAPESEHLPISKLVGPRSGKEAFRRSVQQFKNFRLEKSSRDYQDHKPDSEADSPVVEQSQQDFDPDRISLKLGREKAGGGFMGTSAKLGKLIISDEGLKMCDLVVAACMGIWWQHYDGRND